MRSGRKASLRQLGFHLFNRYVFWTVQAYRIPVQRWPTVLFAVATALQHPAYLVSWAIVKLRHVEEFVLGSILSSELHHAVNLFPYGWPSLVFSKSTAEQKSLDLKCWIIFWGFHFIVWSLRTRHKWQAAQHYDGWLAGSAAQFWTWSVRTRRLKWRTFGHWAVQHTTEKFSRNVYKRLRKRGYWITTKYKEKIFWQKAVNAAKAFALVSFIARSDITS